MYWISKIFNDSKGFGFIRNSDSEKEYFVLKIFND
ncbi:MAG: cold shock domain-containing protein [Bacteroidales bacterium]|nr:cold shock domain-containing protein [Bacteroidales bacterium]MCF8455713.1 cold shock domain-containing protein [Bacteroidales bacterium]